MDINKHVWHKTSHGKTLFLSMKLKPLTRIHIDPSFAFFFHRPKAKHVLSGRLFSSSSFDLHQNLFYTAQKFQLPIVWCLLQVKRPNFWDSTCLKRGQMEGGQCVLLRIPLQESMFGFFKKNVMYKSHSNHGILEEVCTSTSWLPAIRAYSEHTHLYQLGCLTKGQMGKACSTRGQTLNLLLFDLLVPWLKVPIDTDWFIQNIPSWQNIEIYL